MNIISCMYVIMPWQECYNYYRVYEHQATYTVVPFHQKIFYSHILLLLLLFYYNLQCNLFHD